MGKWMDVPGPRSLMEAGHVRGRGWVCPGVHVYQRAEGVDLPEGDIPEGMVYQKSGYTRGVGIPEGTGMPEGMSISESRGGGGYLYPPTPYIDQGYLLTLTPSGNTHAWQAGKTHPTGMLSSLSCFHPR